MDDIKLCWSATPMRMILPCESNTPRTNAANPSLSRCLLGEDSSLASQSHRTKEGRLTCPDRRDLRARRATRLPRPRSKDAGHALSTLNAQDRPVELQV